MNYIPEISEDFREHKKYHDRVNNGFYSHPSKRDKLIWSRDDLRITVVNQLSPEFLRKRAEEVARLAKLDTPYDLPCYCANEPPNSQNIHAFLLHKKNRIVGFLTVEKRDHIWQAKWADLDVGKEPNKLPEHPPIWSICFIWIHNRYRGSHLGQIMINEAVEYLGCKIEKIGWYTPFTDSGKALVRSFCPEVFYIAK